MRHEENYLGSNSRMSTSAGSAVANSTARYTPFGDWRTEPTATLTNRGYTGHLHNNLGSGSDDLGLIYMNARYYLPSSGRFISPDTIVPSPANPQSWNRYSYVENNPLKYTDPTGHKTCEFICPAEHILWNAVTGSAWYGSWDIEAQQQNQAQIEAVVDVGGQVLCGLYDPCDYVQTGVHIVQGEAGTLETLAMALPIIPAVVGRWGDEVLGWGSDVVQWAGNKIDDAIGAFCSFSEETLVMTEDGLVPISEVGLYEKVLAYNEETGEVGYYPVVAIWAHQDPVIVTLTIEGETIETTPEHPFYTDEGEWLPAASLQVGDEIRTSDWGTGTVEAIQFTHQPQLMYNFTVATAHTYFVGEGQWLVHNLCGNREIFDQLIDNSFADSDVAATLALDFLGDYKQIAPDVFRSKQAIGFDADDNPIFGQVRMTLSDLVGHNGGPSHMNFELWMPDSNGRWTQIGNKHLNLTDYVP